MFYLPCRLFYLYSRFDGYDRFHETTQAEGPGCFFLEER